LRTEASKRFEKEVDIEGAIAALDRAVDLLEACGAGVGVAGHLDVWPSPKAAPSTKVRLARLVQVLGLEISKDEARAVWQGLQIKILSETEAGWLLAAPSWRQDLAIEEDYIEEAARLIGYDKIEATLPAGPMTRGYRLPEHQLRRQLAQAMVSRGFREVVNYSFINPGYLESLGVAADHDWRRRAVAIKNPLSEEQGVMRTTVLPSMIQRAAYNIHQRNYSFQLFEMGKVYFAKTAAAPGVQPEEKWTLAALCTGLSEKTWLEAEQPLDFYQLKGAVESVLAAVGVRELRFLAAADLPGLHPGRSARIYCRDRELGYIGDVDPKAAAAFKVNQAMTAASLDLTAVMASVSGAHYHALGRYPEIVRDLAVALPKDVSAAAVAEKIKEHGGVLLQEVRLFDQYMGMQLEENQKSLAFSLTWRSDERTLTDIEIDKLHQAIEEQLAKAFGGAIRGR
jgi:phenylalanyl-tRNA synthetase beta chain